MASSGTLLVISTYARYSLSKGGGHFVREGVKCGLWEKACAISTMSTYEDVENTQTDMSQPRSGKMQVFSNSRKRERENGYVSKT